MKMKFGGIAAMATLVLALGAIGTADAAPTKAQSAVLGNVQIDPNDASVGYVTARYICQGGDEQAHLWVSVKQTADGRPDNALKGEGSSSISDAWVQSHPVPGVDFTCDGAWHTDTFRVDTQEQGFGTLEPGQGWIQFCLFGGDGQPAFAQRFGAVK
jgi:hypothetical protein